MNYYPPCLNRNKKQKWACCLWKKSVRLSVSKSKILDYNWRLTHFKITGTQGQEKLLRNGNEVYK